MRCVSRPESANGAEGAKRGQEGGPRVEDDEVNVSRAVRVVGQSKNMVCAEEGRRGWERREEREQHKWH
jgi:hypothetical protein